ncbi:MAG: hypothetical protein ABIO21_14255, partial [Pseudomonas sp.]
SFQRITLKSSHRVLPSLVHCIYRVDLNRGLAEILCRWRLAAGVASQGVDAVATSTCVEF